MTWPIRSRRSKYGNKKVKVPGMTFDSKGEASLYGLLEMRQKAGEITNLRSQVKVYLTRARIMYIADFAHDDPATGETSYSEYKGFETSDWRIKRRLWKFYGPAPLHIYKSLCGHPALHETIVPKTTTAEDSTE